MDALIIEELRKVSPLMESMQLSTRATIQYHILADAIYWSDEFPIELPRLAENVMRIVLSYRTSLILGTPNAHWEPYWREARNLFPNWIGFRPDRASENSDLAKQISRLRSGCRLGNEM